MNQTGNARVRKLRWKCRRGMKELDILLETFVKANQQALEAGKWPQFEQLLELEDDQLWDCMREPELQQFQQFRSLTDAIRLAQRTDA